MILVGQFDSPFVRRVAVSMKYLEVPFERRPLSVWADAEEVRVVNPLIRVPTLILPDGERLVDSTAILDFLDESVGSQRALLPARGSRRRTALRLIAFALGANEKGVQLIFERVQRPLEKRHEPWISRLRTQISGALSELERVTPSPWLLGDGFSQADITVSVMFRFIATTDPVSVPVGRFPNLTNLAARCEALPAMRAISPE